MRGSLAALLLLAVGMANAEPGSVEKGRVTFKPLDDQAAIPERYRLAEYTFDYIMTPKRELPVSGITIADLTFPSPVKSPHESNNTVHAEYYRPAGKGPFPGVILLDILDGSQVVSRGLASMFAQNDIAALIIQMPYYGPRRPAGEKIRLLSPNINQTMDNIRQTVLDNRCGVAWLESRPEVNKKKLGIHGTSLGSFMGALTAESEPRLTRVSLLLGGGGLVDAYWEHPQAKPLLAALSTIGITRDVMKAAIAPADPITNAAVLKDKRLLMIAASRDDVVPPAAAKTLWEATGKQKIIWLNATHVGAALFLFEATNQIVKFFKED
ncbi:alpha/beta hydrolase [Zavarzinella formosa]|uniref:alpha/beta hydrolase n=1 Tax=Zavarzinella formosa TaxID=360055 RepID=UPI0002E37F89|nr:alpha/beta hydrolase family protein [Zavarzinella formosa]